VAEAAEDFGIRAQIKWPNDIWIGRRKAAGILVEAGSGFAIVGIGININASEFPAELADSATSMKLELGMETLLQDWLVTVVGHIALRHAQIGSGFPLLLAEVRRRCVLAGHAVVLNTAGRKVSGKVIGIDDAGALVLNTSEGRCTVIQADEVRMTD
jgi:BirA family biotin operon repressor/biotin-[acetyl-CoA-carboxylase] ligase